MEADPVPRRSVLWRLAAALLPLVALVLLVRASGLVERLDVDGVRAGVEAAGLWRVPAFVLVYGVGILAYVPGSVFVAAGVLVFGSAWGLLWCYLGALLGNVLSFGLVRGTGYRPLVRVRWPIVARLSQHLAERPLSTLFWIRVLFPTTAPINYVLALTPITTPAYVLASSIGVLPQLLTSVGAFALLFGD